MSIDFSYQALKQKLFRLLLVVKANIPDGAASGVRVPGRLASLIANCNEFCCFLWSRRTIQMELPLGFERLAHSRP